MRIRNTHGLREIHVHMGMFDFGVNVVVGPKEKLLGYVLWKLEIEKGSQRERHITDFLDEEKRGCHISIIGFCPIIWIPAFPRTPREHATLAHEAIHGVFKLFAWADMPLTNDTEEVMTHATAHIVNAVLEEKVKQQR